MPRHVIVDGSNIATEGRKMPSLKQLNDAVTAYIAEFPDDVITVVVDATFGHRIDPSEVSEFDAAVAHNELVAPPAGAIGRGDAFVLSIANKTKGSILSNDSYQEFHGEFPWLFDEGRLIGGKPVPNVGWVFVLRSPVRGPVSRKSVKAGRSVHKVTGQVPRTASKEASQPMPVPKAPPPGATVGRRKQQEPTAEAPAAPAPAPAEGSASAPVKDAPVNELMAFIDFVEHHPVGSSVNAVVESYSSHGAYVTVGSVRGYVPLRLMSDPPARSARELGKVGDAVTLVVHSFTPARRSIDMAVPAAAVKAGVTPRAEPAAVEAAVIAEVAPEIAVPEAPPARSGRRKKAAPPAERTESESADTSRPSPEPESARPLEPRSARPSRRKKAAAPEAAQPTEPTAAEATTTAAPSGSGTSASEATPAGFAGTAHVKSGSSTPSAAPAPKRGRAKKAAPSADAAIDTGGGAHAGRAARGASAGRADRAEPGGGQAPAAEPAQPAPVKRAPAKRASKRTAAPAEATPTLTTSAVSEPNPASEPAATPAKRAAAKKAPAKRTASPAAKQTSAPAPAPAKATKKAPAKRAAKQSTPPPAD